MTEKWITNVSPWRLYIMALAIKNGHCPKIAEERHRKWCVDMGFEKGENVDESEADKEAERNEAATPA